VAELVADEEAVRTAQWTAELASIAERSAVLAADEQTRRTAYLVRRERLADADAAVARLRADAEGVAAIEYVGPLPVYSFLDDLPAGEQPASRSRWGW
jgi:hypothetical protein